VLGEFAADASAATARLTELAQVCSASGSTVMTSCPTQGMVGCCQDRMLTEAVETCYYSRTASEWQGLCCEGNQCPQHYTWSSTSF
jgi:hypothetical protein